MVDARPAARFSIGQVVPVPEQVSDLQRARIVGMEFAAASKFATADTWFYYLSFTPTGLAFKASEDELLAWKGGA